MSNNDRIEAVTQAIHRVRCCDRTDEQSVRYYRDYAEIAVAALDAYDREHGRPRTLAERRDVIEADLRERIATDIEAHPRREWDEADADSTRANAARAYNYGLVTAARLVREAAEVTG